MYTLSKAVVSCVEGKVSRNQVARQILAESRRFPCCHRAAHNTSTKECLKLQRYACLKYSPCSILSQCNRLKPLLNEMGSHSSKASLNKQRRHLSRMSSGHRLYLGKMVSFRNSSRGHLQLLTRIAASTVWADFRSIPILLTGPSRRDT